MAGKMLKKRNSRACVRDGLAASGSADFRRLNPGLFGDSVLAEDVVAASEERGVRIPGPTVRSVAKLNVSEKRVAALLAAQGMTVVGQALRLPLSGGGEYRPDLVAWSPGCASVLVVEVKGGYRGPGWEQGYDRYKRAALEWDGAPLVFVRFERDGSRWRRIYWSEERMR